MLPTLTPLAAALRLIIFVVVASMFLAYVRLLLAALRGDRILPDVPAAVRIVPWGGRSVLLGVAVYILVNALTVNAYVLAKRQFKFQVGPPPSATKPIGKEVTPKPPSTGGVKAKAAEKPERRLNFTEMMALISAVNLILIVCLPLLLRFSSGATPRDLGLTTDSWTRDVKLGLAAFLIVTPFVVAVNMCASRIWDPNKHPLEEMLRAGMTPDGILLAYVSAAVLAPIAEELMFRGMIQGWFNRLDAARTRIKTSPATPDLAEILPNEPEPPGTQPRPVRIPLLPRFPALSWFGLRSKSGRSPLPVVLTSLFFALVHFPQMPAPIAIFFLSLVLGWLYEVTGGLLASIVLHAAFNAFNTTLMVFFLSVFGPAADTPRPQTPPTAPKEKQAGKSTFRLAPGNPADKFPKDLC